MDHVPINRIEIVQRVAIPDACSLESELDCAFAVSAVGRQIAISEVEHQRC